MGAITMGCPLGTETEQEQKFLLSTLTKDQFCVYLRFSNGQTQAALKQKNIKILAPSLKWPIPQSLLNQGCIEVTSHKQWASKIPHHHFPYAVNYIKYRLCDAYTTLYSSCLKCPFSLAKISSHLQYLWIIQNDVFATDFISAL